MCICICMNVYKKHRNMMKFNTGTFEGEICSDTKEAGGARREESGHEGGREGGRGRGERGGKHETR